MSSETLAKQSIRLNPISSKAKLTELAKHVIKKLQFHPKKPFGERTKQGQKQIREVVLEVAGLKTWAKGKAWKKLTIKTFFNKFVKRKKRIQLNSGTVPLKLEKSKSGRFTKKSLKKFGTVLGHKYFGERTHESFLTNALKMLGLKTWNRKLMPSNLTFTQFLRKFVLQTIVINPSRQDKDWSMHRARTPIEEGINYRICREFVIKTEKGRNDTCPLCLEDLPEDQNEVFTAVCEHSICYKCSRDGHQYLFDYEAYNCPLCRQRSTMDGIISNHSVEHYPDDVSDIFEVSSFDDVW
jgi:hypothetical protein